MVAYIKPSIDIAAVEEVLKNHLGSNVAEVIPMIGGNLSNVFSFNYGDEGYVIKFSDMERAYETEGFISELLSSQGVPFPKILGQGKVGTLTYSILERIVGGNLVDCSAEQKSAQLPELIRIMTRMNHVGLGSTSGFGWIRPTGDGTFQTWKDYLNSFFGEVQTGNFWEGWYDLFQTTCLEKEVFDECYSRLMAYSTFNEQHRYFIHGDFHPWNIMSNGQHITGIIDGNCAYGDFLIDLATLDRTLGKLDVIYSYQDYQEQAGIVIPNFKERLIGAQYFKGIDKLRFYSKMGWNDSYFHERNFLLNLTN